LLEIANLCAGYGVTTVLRGLSLTVGDREIITVLGRNGAGKTTLLRAIMGIVHLHSGSIRFDGDDISWLPTHERAQRGLAYVPQGRLVFPGLSVLDNLRVASYGTRQRDESEALGRMFADFPVLAEKRRARAGSLSGGQQQMLALARALMTNPGVLLLDEPSEGIQPSIVDQIADTVRAIHEKRAISVVLVEQNLDFVARLATRAYVVDKGQVVGEFPANEILVNKELQRQYMGV
jgi:urea transport system ATP-binding protein